MIRTFQPPDLPEVSQIWLDTNLQAHSFIPPAYWTERFEEVREALAQAELYVYENRQTAAIDGFIGLTGDYIAGIFVKAQAQSKGTGRQLLDHAKSRRKTLTLHVYRQNGRAVRFYLREGFTIQSQSAGEATGEPEYLMAWNK